MKNRDEYEWGDAASDLALSSTLTLHEAHGVIWGFRGKDLHPYDVLPLLKLIFGSYSEEDRVRGVMGMIDLARAQGEIVGFIWETDGKKIRIDPHEITIVRLAA